MELWVMQKNLFVVSKVKIGEYLSNFKQLKLFDIFERVITQNDANVG